MRPSAPSSKIRVETLASAFSAVSFAATTFTVASAESADTRGVVTTVPQCAT